MFGPEWVCLSLVGLSKECVVIPVGSLSVA